MPNLLIERRSLRHLLDSYIIICKVGRVRRTSTCHKRIKISQSSRYGFPYAKATFNYHKVSNIVLQSMNIKAHKAHKEHHPLARSKIEEEEVPKLKWLRGNN